VLASSQVLPLQPARRRRGQATPTVLTPPQPPGAHAAAAAHAAATRLCNAALALATQPLRTILFLQSWQQPALNLGLLVLLTLACFHAWRLALALWPLWLALAPILNGCD
jgi:hypothetical protein